MVISSTVASHQAKSGDTRTPDKTKKADIIVCNAKQERVIGENKADQATDAEMEHDCRKLQIMARDAVRFVFVLSCLNCFVIRSVTML